VQKKVYIESYGCQMNVSDSEVVASILAKDGYTPVQRAEEADLVLVEHLQHPGESGVHGAAAHQRDEQPEVPEQGL
jgi:tRNA A37 methylthiotransferase MiaB